MPRAQSTNPLTLQSVFFKKETHDALEEASWRGDQTMSELVRNAVDVVVADPSKLGDYPEDPGAGPHHFHLRISEGAWAELKTIARANRRSRSSVLRSIIEHVGEVQA